jgi:CRISPR-associated endonuclease/helicase Cas3
LPESEWQTLDEHSANVSALASRFGSKYGASEILRVAGFLHDYGKASHEFQDYLRNNNSKRGTVPHSLFGAKRV